MTDEAAESRGPATTGTGSSQDAPAPSAAPEPPTAKLPPDPATAELPPAPATAPLPPEPNTAQLPPDPATAELPPDPATAELPPEPPTAEMPPVAAEPPPAWVPPPAGAPPVDDAPLPPPAPPGSGDVPPTSPPPWFGDSSGPTFSRDKLVRPVRGRYVAGVCAAIGRATNTDPVLWRVLLVVLGLFGGVGVLIYLIGWLGIPGEGDAASPIESLLGRGKSAMAPFSVVLLGAAAVLTFAFIVRDGFRATLLGGAVLLGVALLIKRNANQAPAGTTSSTQGAAFPFGSAPARGGPDPTAAFAAAGAPAAPSAPTGPAPAAAPAGEPVTAPLPPRPPGYQPPTAPQFTQPPPGDYRAPFAPHGPYASSTPPPAPTRTPKPPKPPREKSKLGRITFFAVLMVLGLLALIDVAGASVTVSAYFAAALATIGLGLILGAWFGRARGLIALAIITTLGLSISTVAERYGGQVANSSYHPQSLAEVADRYDFKIGNVTLDLRAVDFDKAQQDVTVAMNVGQVKVLLPPNVDTTATVTMDDGRAVLFGHEYTNTDAINITDQGADGAGGGTLRLNVQLKTGNVEVLR